MPKNKEEEQDLQEVEEDNEESEVQEESELSQEDEIEESGIESDLNLAEQGFQEKSFRQFFQPVQQRPMTNTPSLEALPVPEQPTLDDMSQSGFSMAPKEEEKSAMNYDVQPLRVGSKDEYHVQRPMSADAGSIPEVHVGRVDFESIGRGRARLGSEFNFREFQNTAMQSMGMSSAHNEYEEPMGVSEDFNKETSTVMDTEPGFKPRRDYKTR